MSFYYVRGSGLQTRAHSKQTLNVQSQILKLIYLFQNWSFSKFGGGRCFILYKIILYYKIVIIKYIYIYIYIYI